MINNFTMTVITKEVKDENSKDNKYILDICFTPHLKTYDENISGNWNDQHDTFLGKKSRTYMPDILLKENEYFILHPYTLPEWISKRKITTENIKRRLKTRLNVDSDSIIALAGYARYDSNDVILFQNFTKQQVIRPNSFLSLTRGYKELQKNKLIVIGKSLGAIYYPSKKKLLFRAYNFTKRYLGLEEIYYDNSKKIIAKVLDDNIFNCTNISIDCIAEECSNRTRKNFHKLMEGNILGRISINKLQTELDNYKSGNFKHNIEIVDEEIIVPSNDEDINKLLEILNGDIGKRSILKNMDEEYFLIKDKSKY